uniref:Uncharacterized protein n=1 Tax=Quercus lobata TaxID=97700 RepID=A0A7N2N701_QUELO
MHAAMTNQQLTDSGNRMMDKTDQAIGGHKSLFSSALSITCTILYQDLNIKTVQDTINVGTETAAALKDQTEQMSQAVKC